VISWDVVCRVAIVIIVSGCSFHRGGDGQTHRDGGDDAGDAFVGDGGMDGRRDGAPGATCVDAWRDGTIRFDAATPLATINTAGLERDPFLSADELTIYWSSDRAGSEPSGGTDVWKATRATIIDAFGGAAIEPVASTADGSETKVSFTANGLQLVVGSTHAPGIGAVDVWEATRATIGQSFGALAETHEGAVNTATDEHDPTISANGLRLYFAPTSSGTQRIVVASRVTMADDFGAPAVIAALDTGTGDADPTLSADERLIVFTSHQTASAAGVNLWYANRATATGTFGTPVEVPDVNTAGNDGDAHVSSDGCRIYFASDVAGSYDLYVATAM
jgi:Tol biopolymer transport system component